MVGLAVALFALPGAGAAEAVPNSYIHAHRGGPYVNGVPTYPEASLPAFAAAAANGFVLEFDVRRSKDGQPVVMHDITLDRTTNCCRAGRNRTAADIGANCKIDVLGVPGSALPSTQLANPTAAVPEPRQRPRARSRHRRPDQPRDQERPDRQRLRPHPGIRQPRDGRADSQRDRPLEGDRPELLAAQPGHRPAARARCPDLAADQQADGVARVRSAQPRCATTGCPRRGRCRSSATWASRTSWD